jgi:lipopolysaccharide transport system ATP-binding protein
VASLLEVGTGFHPELTGRENIFVNGAILGMTQAEIRQKFDEIVAFAEVERFLDTPVKRYSSGMYIRLAFAVAAHLNPEILLVDEVLAVGDAEFQKKCLGKIESVTANEGRTVIFISHNTNALLSLCKRGILLERGKVAVIGSMVDVIDQYFSKNTLASTVNYDAREDQPSITRVAMDHEALKTGDLILDVDFTSPIPLNPPNPEIIICSNYGLPVFGSNTRIHKFRYSGKNQRAGTMHFEAKKLPLVSGYYTVTVWLGDGRKPFDHKDDALFFEFKAADDGVNPEKHGHLNWPCEWQLG